MDKREQHLSVVKAALGRSRRASVLVALLMLGIAAIIRPGLEDLLTRSVVLAWGVTACFAAVSAVLLWVGFYKNSPRRSPLIRALREDPDAVVWLFQQDVQVSLH